MPCVFLAGTLHELIDIGTADSDRKKTYCGKYGETSSNIIRNHESLITFFRS